MLQQLPLFPAPTLTPVPTPASDHLVKETRQLFQHQGSDAELIERIQHAVRVLNKMCEKSN